MKHLLKKLLVIASCLCVALSVCACEGLSTSSDKSDETSQSNSASSVENSESQASQSTVESNSTGASTSTSITASQVQTSTSQVKTSSSATTTVSASKSNNSGLSADDQKVITQAENAVTWQIENNGGWDKDNKNIHFNRKFGSKSGDKKNMQSGWTAKNGQMMGMIDNGATYTHMQVIAKAYGLTNDANLKATFKKSFEDAMVFLTKLEGPNGGFKQVYPARGNYSDYITLNDDAMAKVLEMLELIKLQKAPFNTDIVSSANRKLASDMIDRGINYLLKSQITVKGVKSAWCAQHDPSNYKPLGARAYELPSVSGSESIQIIKFLAKQTGNSEAVAAAKSAAAWFKSHKLDNMKYDKSKSPYFFASSGSTVWYRFYSLDTGEGFFSDRDGKVYYDIMQISTERAEGYTWAGTWPASILNI